jgi:hypothetical protein
VQNSFEDIIPQSKMGKKDQIGGGKSSFKKTWGVENKELKWKKNDQ